VDVTTIGQISVGVHDDQRAANFRSQALGYVRRPPRYPGDDWIVLQPPTGGSGTAIAMDVSESPPRKYPRTHLDLDAGDRDLDEEANRLLALGAQHVNWPHYPPNPNPAEPSYVVLADPEGNIFCLSGTRSLPQRDPQTAGPTAPAQGWLTYLQTPRRP
jgi:predicted enzyme related to lactoylglutathione lyase